MEVASGGAIGGGAGVIGVGGAGAVNIGAGGAGGGAVEGTCVDAVVECNCDRAAVHEI